MNRPNIEDHRVVVGVSSLTNWKSYTKAQDRYIDYLEEKSKPKMVVFKRSTLTFFNDLVDVYGCPTCGHEESTRGTSKDLSTLVNYCSHCGQKLLHKGDNHE